MNDKFRRKQPWHFKVLFQHLPEGTEENYKDPSRIASFYTENQTWNLPCIKQEY